RPVRDLRNPLVKADRAWEQGGSGVNLDGGTVFYDIEEERFKMWYRTNYSIFERAPNGGLHIATGGAYVSCYATSKDGLRWEKPTLKLTDFRGSRENNILPPGKGGRDFIRRPNLIKDTQDPDPQRRYKMAYLDEIDEKFALISAYSADGIHWIMNADAPTFFP